jgi:hypothetical protein
LPERCHSVNTGKCDTLDVDIMATSEQDGSTMATLKNHVEFLAREHGSMRAAASAVGVDVSTLSRLRSGDRGDHISDELLARLGLERVVTLRRIKGKG